jgi:RNA-directed DNA polymerase
MIRYDSNKNILSIGLPDNDVKRENDKVIVAWDWDAIVWKRARQIVFNLQKRIYKAAKLGKIGKAKHLARLLQNSTSNIVLAVRRVTTDNTGKRTGGIDKRKCVTPKQKMALVEEVMKTVRNEWDKYKPLPARRVLIPKKNGKMRPLGIPTIKDRAMQAATKQALEPYYEAKFEPNSYGFRPAMGCHDAIDKIASNLLKKQKWIMDADITGCFDNIDHDYLAKQVDKHWRPIIRQWLKAGYIFNNEFNATKMGTPQGGTISPLLANIALDQMETDLIEHLRGIKGWKKKIGSTKVSTVKEKKTGKEYKYRKNLKLELVRYADDFVIIHEDKEVISESKRYIQEWLKIRGLTLSEEKTKIVHSTSGFDFLGHHFRHYPSRIKGTYKLKLLNGSKTEQNRAKATHEFRAEPTKDAVKKHWRVISDTIWKMKNATPEALIGKIQPMITGWANYYRASHSSEAFSKLDYLLYQRLSQWAYRRHPNKGKKWVVDKYFGHADGRNWVLVAKKDGKIVKAIRAYAKHKVATGSYARVEFDRSFYDGDTKYWAARLSKGYGNITPSKAKMLKKQGGICPECKGKFTDDDLMETHHKVLRSRGGDNKYTNLVLLHRHCHDKLHAAEKTRHKKEGQFIGGGKDQRAFY